MKKAQQKNPLLWVFEPLEDDAQFFRRKFFGFEGAHLGTKIYLAAAADEEPWNGLLVCTAKEHHASLLKQFPQLTVHPVLGKWLYLQRDHGEFESVALELAGLARRRDKRLGVESKSRMPRG